jgi:hypothetical protein
MPLPFPLYPIRRSTPTSYCSGFKSAWSTFDKLDRLSDPFSAECILTLGLARQKTGYMLELATALTTA